jgi:hypothetical protein
VKQERFFVEVLEPHRVDGLLVCFPAEDFYLPSAEFVGSVISGGGSFSIIYVPSGCKFDVIVRRRTVSRTATFLSAGSRRA